MCEKFIKLTRDILAAMGLLSFSMEYMKFWRPWNGRTGEWENEGMEY